LPLDARYSFDAGYVERLAAGDPETERHFTQYFGDLLTAKLRARLRAPALVADAKQETFVRVLATLRQKGGLTDAGSLGAFVNSVCNNVLFETYRSEARRRREVDDETIDPPDPDADAETTLVVAADRTRVREALQELGERDRQLLRWLFFEERNKDTICESLGCDRGHLRVMLHRAKGRFREAYEKGRPSPPAARPAP
jgi:RNA polymerase sigma-70 factor (ECF subfamily)